MIMCGAKDCTADSDWRWFAGYQFDAAGQGGPVFTVALCRTHLKTPPRYVRGQTPCNATGCGDIATTLYTSRPAGRRAAPVPIYLCEKHSLLLAGHDARAILTPA